MQLLPIHFDRYSLKRSIKEQILTPLNGGNSLCVLLMQRPLKAIALRCGDVYIPRGVAVPALNRDKAYEFAPKNLGKVLFSHLITSEA